MKYKLSLLKLFKNMLRYCGRLYPVLIFIIILFINSCQKDTNSSSLDARDQYTGVWNVDENSSLSGSYKYDVSIENDPSNSSQVLIFNFYNLGSSLNVFAIATESSLTIPSQTNSGDKISGSGILSNKNKISLQYTVTVGGDIDHVTATYTR